jgi:hypothetical protein
MFSFDELATLLNMLGYKIKNQILDDLKKDNLL